jgi:hypothetical protein
MAFRRPLRAFIVYLGDRRYDKIAGLFGGGAVVAWSAYWGVYCANPSGLSWHFFYGGARRMVGLNYRGYVLPGGLHLFANYPQLQIGPLSFVAALPLAVLPRDVAQPIAIVRMAVAGPLTVWLVADAAKRLRPWSTREAIWSGVAAWVFVAPLWFQLSIRFGHLDDALALLLLAAAINALSRANPTVAALCIGAAAASKPWAIATIPLALAATDGRRLRHLVEAAVVAVLPWLPFVLGDSRTIHAAGSFKIRVVPTSALALFNVTGGTPSWVRPVQFAGGALLVALCVASGRWAAAVLIAVALRLGTDPNVYPYYSTGLLVGAAIWDLLGSRLRVPLLTAAAFVTMYWSTFWSLSNHTEAALRFATILAMPLLVLATAARDPVRSSAELHRAVVD